jgi:hypothetical protein
MLPNSRLKRNTRKHHIWSILNTGVGLLFLGTVGGGLLTWGAKEVWSYRQARQSEQALASKVRTEIDLRLTAALRVAYSDAPRAGDPSETLTRLNTHYKDPLFKEYPFEGLVQQYARLIPHPPLAEHLVQEANSNIATLAVLKSGPQTDATVENVRRSLTNLQRELDRSTGVLIQDCRIPSRPIGAIGQQ